MAESERARVNDGTSGVGIVARERGVARACLGDGTGTGDDAGVAERVGAVEREVRIVDDISKDFTGGAASPDLQGTGGDGCRAGVGIGARESQGAGAGFDKIAFAVDSSAQAGIVAIGVDGGGGRGDQSDRGAGGGVGGEVEGAAAHVHRAVSAAANIDPAGSEIHRASGFQIQDADRSRT